MTGEPGLWKDAGGRIRSGWRVVLWLGAVSAALVLASLLGVGRLPLVVANAVRLALVAVVSLLTWRLLDGREPRETLVAIDRRAARGFGGGILAGFCLVGLALVPVALSGSLEILPRQCRVDQQATFWASTGALFLVGAALEELVFRGYPLSALASGPGRLVAVIATSAAFALLHAGNPHYDATAGIVLFGIGSVLAVSVLQRGSVWEAVGAHAGWNWMLASGLGLQVSGVAMPSPCYSGALTGPMWLTGGGFGLEAGVPGAIVWALAGAGLWWRARRRRPVEGPPTGRTRSVSP